MSSYFGVVRKTFADLVPKTVMCFLVNHTKGAGAPPSSREKRGLRSQPGPAAEHIQSELVSRLYKEEIFTELLRESSDVAERRKECTEMKLILEKALRIVNEVRDLSLR